MNSLAAKHLLASLSIDDVDERLLPPQLRLLIKVLGLPATLRLLRHYGGTDIQWPTGTGVSRKWQAFFGVEVYGQLLASDIAGEKMSLPKADKLIAQLRNKYICSQKGIKCKRELAQELDLSTRHILNIWQGVNPGDVSVPPQADLFGEVK